MLRSSASPTCGPCTRSRRDVPTGQGDATMAIRAGERMPAGTLKRMTKEGPKDISTDELFKGKLVVLFSVPGAFTPTCDAKHLPGFVQLADQIRARGVDTLACMAVNDVAPGQFKVSAAEYVLGQL